VGPAWFQLSGVSFCPQLDDESTTLSTPLLLTHALITPVELGIEARATTPIVIATAASRLPSNHRFDRNLT